MQDQFHDRTFDRVEQVTKTADFDGADIDLLGYPAANVYVDVAEVGTAGGALDGATTNWQLCLYHAPESTVTPDTAGTYVLVPDAQMLRRADQVTRLATLTVADGAFAGISADDHDEQAYGVGYIPDGLHRFLRVRYEATGSPGSTIFTAFAQKFLGRIPV